MIEMPYILFIVIMIVHRIDDDVANEKLPLIYDNHGCESISILYQFVALYHDMFNIPY